VAKRRECLAGNSPAWRQLAVRRLLLRRVARPAFCGRNGRNRFQARLQGGLSAACHPNSFSRSMPVPAMTLTSPSPSDPTLRRIQTPCFSNCLFASSRKQRMSSHVRAAVYACPGAVRPLACLHHRSVSAAQCFLCLDCSPKLSHRHPAHAILGLGASPCVAHLPCQPWHLKPLRPHAKRPTPCQSAHATSAPRAAPSSSPGQEDAKGKEEKQRDGTSARERAKPARAAPKSRVGFQPESVLGLCAAAGFANHRDFPSPTHRGEATQEFRLHPILAGSNRRR